MHRETFLLSTSAALYIILWHSISFYGNNKNVPFCFKIANEVTQYKQVVTNSFTTFLFVQIFCSYFSVVIFFFLFLTHIMLRVGWTLERMGYITIPIIIILMSRLFNCDRQTGWSGNVKWIYKFSFEPFILFSHHNSRERENQKWYFICLSSRNQFIKILSSWIGFHAKQRKWFKEEYCRLWRWRAN